MLLAFPIATHLDYFLCSSAADATETSLPSLGSLLSTHFLPDGANYGPGLVMRAGAVSCPPTSDRSHVHGPKPSVRSLLLHKLDDCSVYAARGRALLMSAALMRSPSCISCPAGQSTFIRCKPIGEGFGVTRTRAKLRNQCRSPLRFRPKRAAAAVAAPANAFRRAFTASATLTLNGNFLDACLDGTKGVLHSVQHTARFRSSRGVILCALSS